MHLSATLAASVLAVGASATNYLGFNSGSTNGDGSAKTADDFKSEFTTAQNLKGAPGNFNAFRLYTNIQGDTTADPSTAFQAAIDTKTYLLLGVWASGTDNIDNEITALKAAVSQYGSDFTDLVIGVSIGSEDLYRDSETGIENNSGIGNSPKAIVGFVSDFKKAFASTALSSTPIGHVDTWETWTNGSNSAVIDAIDWLGVDEYPYYQNATGNSIKNAGSLFDEAYSAVVGAAGGKDVWVTETGWPYTGPNWDEAVASVANAKYYWDEVGCRVLFNKVPTFWYTLQDDNSDNTMEFGITEDGDTTPRFNLTCPTTFDTASTATGSATSGTPSATGKSKTKSAATSTGFASVSASGTGAASTATATGSSSGSSSSGSSGSSGSGSSSGSGTSGSSASGTGSAASSTSTPAKVDSGAATLKVSAAAFAVVAGVLAML